MTTDDGRPMLLGKESARYYKGGSRLHDQAPPTIAYEYPLHSLSEGDAVETAYSVNESGRPFRLNFCATWK